MSGLFCLLTRSGEVIVETSSQSALSFPWVGNTTWSSSSSAPHGLPVFLSRAGCRNRKIGRGG